MFTQHGKRRRAYCTMPAALVCMVMILAGSVAQAAAPPAGYPKGPITLIVSYAAGGGSDAGARILANAAEKHVGKPIVVQNKPGAGGGIGWASLVASKPDGYTICLINIPSMILLPLQGRANYTLDQIVPVMQLVDDPGVLLVRKGGKFKTFADYVQYAKDNPGKLTVGNPGAGSDIHIVTEMMNDKLGIKLNPIPFGGTAEAVTSTVGGHTDSVFAKVSEAVSALEAGQAILLATFTEKRLPQYPDIPTLRELGVDMVASSSRGIGVPKGTPKEIIEFLHDKLRRATEEPEYKERMKNAELAIEYRNGPDFGKFYMEQYRQFEPVIKRLGLAK